MTEPAPNPTNPSQPAISQDIFCQTCGYNLRGLTGNRCPECGGSLDGVRSLVPQIPWMYRKELGWWRAYLRTVWFVMFRQARFCDEMARPVSFRDSQSFRWVTVLFVGIPSVLPLVCSHRTVMGYPIPRPDHFVFHAVAEGWPLVILYVCWLLFLAAATGVPSYFFHPREIPVQQQNRAIALSYYACGPLAFMAIPLLTCAAAIITSDVKNPTISMVSGILAFTLPVAAIAPWWLDLIHLARRLVPQLPDRDGWVGIGLPILWGLLAGLIIFVLPVILGYVVVIFASLR